MSRKLFTATIAFALIGCGTLDDAEQISADLELEDGGFDTADEAPSFGEEAVFAETVDVETSFADPLDDDATVTDMSETPDAAIYAVALQWGQMPGDPENTAWRDWSGTLSVNRGAILVRKIIRFEDATDAIAPRTTPGEVSFTSRTRPFNDGLRLSIIDPDPASAEPLVLTYQPADGTSHALALVDLMREPLIVTVDEAGNRLVAVALRRPLESCGHGFLAGRWQAVQPGLGRFRGRVTDEDGELVGHVRGVYGTRANGEHVFFGKYIAIDGTFQGILRGRAEDQHFGGVWADRDGERGHLGGMFRESRPGDDRGGHFLGRWAEGRCNLDLDDAPAPTP